MSQLTLLTGETHRQKFFLIDAEEVNLLQQYKKTNKPGVNIIWMLYTLL